MKFYGVFWGGGEYSTNNVYFRSKKVVQHKINTIETTKTEQNTEKIDPFYTIHTSSQNTNKKQKTVFCYISLIQHT